MFLISAYIYKIKYKHRNINDQMKQLRRTQKDSFKKVLAKCRTLKIHYVGYNPINTEMKRKLTINSQTLQGNIFILTQASISLKSVEGREQVLIQEVKELIYLG